MKVTAEGERLGRALRELRIARGLSLVAVDDQLTEEECLYTADHEAGVYPSLRCLLALTKIYDVAFTIYCPDEGQPTISVYPVQRGKGDLGALRNG